MTTNPLANPPSDPPDSGTTNAIGELTPPPLSPCKTCGSPAFFVSVYDAASPTTRSRQPGAASLRCLECYHGHPAMIHSRWMLVGLVGRPGEFHLVAVDERLQPVPIEEPDDSGREYTDPGRGTLGGTGRPPDRDESLDSWFERLPVGAENLLVGVATTNPIEYAPTSERLTIHDDDDDEMSVEQTSEPE